MAEASTTQTGGGNNGGKTSEPPVPMFIPVTSNRGNITIPLTDKRGRQQGVVELFAGPNLIPADKWEQAKKQKMTNILLEETIKPTRAPEQNQLLVGKKVLVEGAPVPASAPLAAMTATAATEMVKDIVDAMLLKQLLVSESRGPVRRAIEARIADINDPSKTSQNASEVSTKGTISME